jgi:hypothetical protein
MNATTQLLIVEDDLAIARSLREGLGVVNDYIRRLREKVEIDPRGTTAGDRFRQARRHASGDTPPGHEWTTIPETD